MFLVLAAISSGYVYWLAPESRGRPLESIRGYRENGGRWPGQAPPGPPACRAGAGPRRGAA